jgi:cytochrome c-type biogenesis protein
VRRVLENRSMQTGSRWFRRLAAVGVGALGLYFVGLPFFDS